MFILFENDTLRPRAEKLGEGLSLPVYSKGEKLLSINKRDQEFFLVLTETHLELQISDSSMVPFFIDFNDKDLHYRLQHSNRKNEALARAIGLKKNRTPVVFDLTAGLGRDAFVLAKLGCTLHLFERNKILAALLQDGLTRASQSNLTDMVKNMTLHTGDARNLLKDIAHESPPDVLYMDPMFPHRTKTALVKKEMRIIRSIVGDDIDSSQLLREAKKYARDRVVCKRPRHASFVNDTQPSMSIKTKKHRFDVYLTHGDLKLET